METCVTFLNIIKFQHNSEAFLKGNVFSLSDRHLTFAPYNYNIASESPYEFEEGEFSYISSVIFGNHGKICTQHDSRSNILLEKLIKTGKLISTNTPPIQDPNLKLCLREIIQYNNKLVPESKRVHKNQRKQFATSILGKPGKFCTHKHLAILAATGHINYKGPFDCWNSRNKPLGFEESTQLPLVNADAPMMAYILDHTRDEFYVELNGNPYRALRSSIYGEPIVLVNIAPKKFKLIGGVAPRGVKLLSKENIIQIEKPLEFTSWRKDYWLTGDIVC
ncbi:hypothetical protein GcM3_040034 [Golovinomyces cichoracearum]|uniref:Uncharacterized protein n=1 Tax=Golovinomyces cichoracearum TaxID=62708 RepID=A0A420J2G3_9PEZI|nr:hypothetical protein GcM3_040034 [Golovinomyces cichoracearum]